jgi:single-strand DNA-binding protein
MSAKNNVTLIGNLARDPEAGRGATALARMTVAVDAYNSSTKSRDTDFINVTAFGKTAEFVLRYLKKGSGVVVRAHLKPRSWNDTRTGDKKFELSVVADEVEFGPKGGGAVAPDHKAAPGAVPFDEAEDEDDSFSLLS